MKDKDDTERERVRKKNRKKSVFLSFIIVLFLGAIGALGYFLSDDVMEFIQKYSNEKSTSEKTEEVVLDVEIINEKSDNVSSRTEEYISLLKEDLKEYGYEMLRVVLPSGKMREIDVDIEGVKPYFRINTDRGAGETAEDIDRMVRYINERGLSDGISYVDVRVEGKAFYK